MISVLITSRCPSFPYIHHTPRTSRCPPPQPRQPIVKSPNSYSCRHHDTSCRALIAPTSSIGSCRKLMCEHSCSRLCEAPRRTPRVPRHPGSCTPSRASTEKFATYLSAHGVTALPYHAGLDAATRRDTQDRFLREDGIVIVATIAFGMGIDKPDVRFVAHVDLPKSVEGYYQETGRAGRDGDPAIAWLTYGLQDVVQQRRMIDESPGDLAHRRRLSAHLDAMLALCETVECRRQNLLAYFGEASAPC